MTIELPLEARKLVPQYGPLAAARRRNVGRLPKFVVLLTAALLALLVQALGMVLSEQFVRDNLSLLYGVQITAYLVLVGFSHNFEQSVFLRPSTLTTIYLGGSIVLGAISFETGNVLRTSELATYHAWSDVKQTFQVVSLSLFVIFLSGEVIQRKNFGAPVVDGRRQIYRQGVTQVATLAVLVPIFFGSLFLKDTLLAQSKSVIFVSIVYVLYRSRVRFRLLVSILLIIAMAVSTPHSKREAIFAIIPLAVLAVSFNPSKVVSARHVLIGIGVIVGGIVLVLAASIVRGYGQFYVSDFGEAVSLIPTYVSNSRIWEFASRNFEYGYVFYHLHNASDIALHDVNARSYGQTYYKILFTWPISEVLGFVPLSLTEAYTSFVNPDFRLAGGSWVITSIGEAIWNFGWLGLPILFIVYATLDGVYYRAIGAINGGHAILAILLLCVIQFTMYYSRGSGFHLFCIYVIYSAILSIPLGYLASRGEKSISSLAGREFWVTR